jgi:dihydrofolate reductase
MIVPSFENHPPLGIVVAMTAAGVIGRDGKLPWELPADRRLFRQLTEGGTVIMGRLTFESLPAPLANRRNIVVTRSGRRYPGAETAPSLKAALELARRIGQPTFVIGGGALYREALPLADTLHVSWIEGEFAGDRHFPAFDLAAWDQIDSVDYPGFRYITYRRAAQHPAS